MSDFERKSDKVRRLVAAGDHKQALAIAKSFRLGITKEQHSTLLRAYECLVHPSFYQSIGTDIAKAITDGVTVLNQIYR